MLTKKSNANSHSSESVLGDKCIITLIILFALLSTFLFQTHFASAASVSAKVPQRGFCSNPKPNGHCYAVISWYGDVGGAQTELDPFGSISCPGCHVGFIDNEMWLADKSTGTCINAGDCWVESGISTYLPNEPKDCNPGHASTCLFWADNRPGGGGYTEWPLYTVGPDGTSLDPFYFDLQIADANSSSATSDRWNTAIDIYKNASYVTTVTGNSTRNGMTTDHVDIGSELANGSASAGVNYFRYNSSEYPPTGGYLYQPVQGNNIGTNPPPQGLWAIYPCNCTGNTGGSWETYD